MMQSLVIAIDGPSGVGKSSVAKELAHSLNGWFYLDTGAMYRAITWAWIQDGRAANCLDNPEWLQSLELVIDGSRVVMNGADISKAIRERQVTAHASEVAAEAAVRTQLTHMQQAIGKKGSCIVDGRDIGTVVFPNAFLKVFLEASPDVRARRRWLQLGGEQSGTSVEQLIKDIERRDAFDSGRAVAPLKPAEDAWHIQTDTYSKAEVTHLILEEALVRCPKLSRKT